MLDRVIALVCGIAAILGWLVWFENKKIMRIFNRVRRRRARRRA